MSAPIYGNVRLPEGKIFASPVTLANWNLTPTASFDVNAMPPSNFANPLIVLKPPHLTRLVVPEHTTEYP